MKKFIFRVLATLFFIVLFVQFSFYWVEDAKWGNETYAAKYRGYEKLKGEINTLFIGSSRMHSHINSIHFDELLQKEQIRSYNLGAPYTFTPENYFLYNDFLSEKDTTIKYVFLELNALHIPEWSKIRTKRAFYWKDTKTLNFALNYILASNYSIQKKIATPALYLISYLNKVFSLAHLSPKKDPVYCTGEHRKGFCPMKKREDFLHGLDLQRQLAIQYYQTTDNSSYLNSFHLSYIQELLEISRKNNIHLILLISPRGAFQYPEILALKEKIPSKHLIDLGSAEVYPAFYTQENSVDLSHLTEEAAMLFTETLAQKFKEKWY